MVRLGAAPCSREPKRSRAVDPVPVSVETDDRLAVGLFWVSRQLAIAVLAMSVVLLSTCSPATERQSLPEGFSLADPVWLEDEIGSTLCQRLYFEGRPLGSVGHMIPARAGDSIVFEECREYAPGRGGGLGWFVSAPRDPAFRRLELEGLGPFSNPSACGSLIAYWGSEEIPNDNTYKLYSAYVADVPSRQVRCREVLGRAWMGTDFKGHSPYPRWDEECSTVLMDDDRYFHPVRLALVPSPRAPRNTDRPSAQGPQRVPGIVGAACTLDPLDVIYVDDDARPLGDGSIWSPFHTIGEALRLRKPGDTIRLLPGRYDQPLKLVGDVTIRGSGADWTVVAGEAYRGLAIAPFEGLGNVPSFVELANFAVKAPAAEGGPTYPDYDASTLSVLLGIVNAIDRPAYSTVWKLVREYPGLASMRYYGPWSARGSGDTLLHRSAYKRLDGLSETLEKRHRTHRLIAGVLIDAGADVNANGSSNHAGGAVSGTPLHAAVTRNRLALARLLLDRGADVGALDSAGHTPLARAVGNQAMTEMLLSYGAKTTKDGASP